MRIILSTNNFKSMLKAMDKIKDKELNKCTDLLIDASGSIESSTRFIKSNGETTIIYNVKHSVEEEGEVILPLETAEIIKKVKENSITILDNKITTERKNISFSKLHNIEINTYESIDKVFTVTQRELLRMLEVIYAVAQDNTRPVLNGVCFNKNETCALDGYRLSLRKSKEYNSEVTFIVNMFSIDILKSILRDNDELVEVYYNNKDTVKFAMNDITVIANCIEGEFIKYNSIIPNEYTNKSTVKPEELAEELEFIKAADKSNVVRTLFTQDHNLILKGNQQKEEYSEELSYKDLEERQKELDREYKEKLKKWQEKGKKDKEPKKKEAKFKRMYKLIPLSEITSELNSINKLNNDSFEIAYNPNYMIDAVEQYKDEVQLRMTNVVSPIILTKDDTFGLELVLPVRIKAA